MRLGRNDVCRCGSGKKYKKCCLNRQARPAAGPTYWAHPPGQPGVAPPAGGEWVEYVFVKDKGWIHESQLKPGDQYRLKGGGWGTVQPERVIRTTQEHPFFVMGKGWTPVGEIRPGDMIRTEDGWVPVQDVRDTGQWEKVYNLRVEDYHTYFVGAPEWGFAVWAHNTYNSPELARAARALREGRTNEIVVRNANEAREVFFREFRSGRGVPSYRDTTGWSKAQVDVHGKAGTYHWDTVFDGRTSALDSMKGRSVLRGHYDDGKLHNYVPHLQIHTFDGRIVRILFGG
jgi:hypothetical protein